MAELKAANDAWVNGRDSMTFESAVDVGDRDGSSAAQHETSASDMKLGFVERSFSAAGAAFLSAIIVNPLDVAKVFECFTNF